MRKTLAIIVSVFALTAWVVAQTGAKQAERITNGPVVEAVTGNSATIAWSTNTGGSSVVKYGTDPNNLNQTAEEPYHMGHGTHRVEIKNLKPGTAYYYRVESAHGQGTGTEAQSQVGQFTTSGQGGQAAAPGQAAQPAQGAQAANGTKVPLYRAYNPSTGAHLFTHSYQEESTAVSQGWKQEGIAGYIMNNQAPGAEPLYRLSNAKGDHFYTANANEASQAASRGYTNEGIAGYISSTQQPGTTPLFRLVDPNNGDHFYTNNPSERQQDLSKGWKDEGIVGYVWTS